MGVVLANCTTPHSHEYISFLHFPNAHCCSQITSLDTFILSRQRAKHIVHTCWQIAHRVLTTTIFGRLEPGRVVGLYFPAPDYLPFDNLKPNFLLDCYALERAEMLESRGNDLYSWLDGNKHPIYILPSCIGDSFLPDDPATWLPPDQLTPACVLPESEDEEQRG
ncbi:unnamed protein product [Lactuca saligna]|uniref:Uncharacterized protein n=1 Tax=Lactuca saligna TaxID=75948 RepID=A0AA35VSG0_LACSI|nr:unnamed protein product [Lactuca saligna]